MQVYYLPLLALHSQASLPTLFCSTPLLRVLLLRERIDLVHAHQSTSGLAHEALLVAAGLGLGCVFTDHSLFSLNSGPSLQLNRLMQFTLSHAHAAIAVSHCARENLVVRSNIAAARVSVIPNAVDADRFKPDPTRAPDASVDGVTVVILSRLAYRKGVDLLLDVLPRICRSHATVRFVIGGDGPKRAAVDQMREAHGLQARVEMLGAVAHSDVRSVLTRGHVFLNCSLTESFCIAVLEAVSAGLTVVATNVGGVGEILPEGVIHFAQVRRQNIAQRAEQRNLR